MGRREDREQYLLEAPDIYEKYNGYPVGQELDPYDHRRPRRSSTASRDYNSGHRRNSRTSVDYDAPGRSVRLGNKRLIIACDGTWQDSTALPSSSLNPTSSSSARERDQDLLKPPTNITRITRAIKPQSSSGVPQITYYAAGPGSSNNPIDRVVNGALGAGVYQSIRECFAFLSNNYTPGDEIFFLGYSRGAFTARSVTGMVANLGVLTKKGLEYFPIIMKDYQHRYEKNYRSPHPDEPFSNKPSASDPRYVAELYRRGLTIPDVKIKVVGVWDTVGNLGIPKIGWLQKLGMGSRKKEEEEMRFHDTVVSEKVEFAFQALALDERRSSFVPTVWELPRKGSRTVLRQTWMPGEHSNIGGGFEDHNLANVSLAWMISNLTPFLDFDDTYLLDEFDSNIAYYKKKKLKPRAWGFGKIANSMEGVYALAGSTTRTPGDYTRADPNTGEPTGKFLKHTLETIHPSVRVRVALKGYGVDDEGYYNPPALQGWKVRFDDAARRYKWVNKQTGVELYEMDLGPVEKELLRVGSPGVWRYLYGDGKGGSPGRGEELDLKGNGEKRRSVKDGVADEVVQMAGVIKGLLGYKL